MLEYNLNTFAGNVKCFVTTLHCPEDINKNKENFFDLTYASFNGRGHRAERVHQTEQLFEVVRLQKK